MECKRAKELFIGYHDGDLGERDQAALEKHLDDCDTCTTEWNGYLKTVGEISGLFRLAPPQDFASRVKQTIDRRSKGRFFGESGPFSIGFAVISFILILLFLLAYLFISQGTEFEIVLPEGNAASIGSDGDASAEPTPRDRP
ncbi:MAG: zf-HC2 domain-containing protein [Proteobacteria bacterium]|nr:zf-HC2 domain-containing protein [Pseudomonadota bacterium]